MISSMSILVYIMKLVLSEYFFIFVGLLFIALHFAANCWCDIYNFKFECSYWIILKYLKNMTHNINLVFFFLLLFVVYQDQYTNRNFNYIWQLFFKRAWLFRLPRHCAIYDIMEIVLFSYIMFLSCRVRKYFAVHSDASFTFGQLFV